MDTGDLYIMLSSIGLGAGVIILLASMMRFADATHGWPSSEPDYVKLHQAQNLSKLSFVSIVLSFVFALSVGLSVLILGMTGAAALVNLLIVWSNSHVNEPLRKRQLALREERRRREKEDRDA